MTDLRVHEFIHAWRLLCHLNDLTMYALTKASVSQELQQEHGKQSNRLLISTFQFKRRRYVIFNFNI